ncbi:UxaA family hydrolase [Pseudothermotoga sp.]|uniref:UxaA family hydrolase n=1 Tax=Pseudothermotoga sp. TaxID=2033661 RepID=UPI0031F69AAC
MVHFLVHKPIDHVGVAVKDLKKGETAFGRCLETNQEYRVFVLEDIPLGHKIALKDIEKGEHVIEYGEKIGFALQHIPKGSHVHIHNLRSLRWG